MDLVKIKEMEKVKLVIPDEELKDFSRFKHMKLNLNGSKHKKSNLYKKQLSQIRRLLR